MSVQRLGSTSHSFPVSEPEEKAPQPMSPHLSDTLDKLKPVLQYKIIVNNGLNDRLMKQAGGFMDEGEAMDVTDIAKNHEQVAEILEILKTKSDREFSIFLTMLDNENYIAWANELRKDANERAPKGVKPFPLTPDPTLRPHSEENGINAEQLQQRGTQLEASVVLVQHQGEELKRLMGEQHMLHEKNRVSVMGELVSATAQPTESLTEYYHKGMTVIERLAISGNDIGQIMSNSFALCLPKLKTDKMLRDNLQGLLVKFSVLELLTRDKIDSCNQQQGLTQQIRYLVDTQLRGLMLSGVANNDANQQRLMKMFRGLDEIAGGHIIEKLTNNEHIPVHARNTWGNVEPKKLS